MEKRNKIIYWIATGLFCFGMLASGLLQVIQSKEWVDIIVKLGYPPYLLPIIGVWKILGIVVILLPGFKILKEWAYAGFFFVMTGAIASHLLNGGSVTGTVGPLVTLGLIMLSWYFRSVRIKSSTENSMEKR